MSLQTNVDKLSAFTSALSGSDKFFKVMQYSLQYIVGEQQQHSVMCVCVCVCVCVLIL
jgi:hypothetical protein